MELLLERGQYLGDISALCFLHLSSSLPLLLAGTGSQILVYDLFTGKILRSFQVFQGIRVHGISSHSSSPSSLDFRISVFGERRVKLFNLHIGGAHKPFHILELTLTHSLPNFAHWVLDACFLKDGATSTEDACYLAIGCSDNSVYFWDILRCTMFSQVRSAERCLLYSMRMLGNEIESLRVASGTIFNEIVVWKVINQNDDLLMHGSHAKDRERLSTDEDFLLPGPKYKDAVISRLVGHEGSIFRIAWFPDGLKLVSVSDDRSARIWRVEDKNEFSSKVVQDTTNHLAGPVLFGHNARIWDCCIFDSLIITAGEDCTCRVWDHDGRELNEIKEHIGRGVWRCLYDPGSSLLVTAGFDSAIKIHRLYMSSKGLEGTVSLEDSSDRKEVFALSIPNSSGHGGFMDSKSEYVRCLHFSSEDSLYVATNNGYLYHVSLFVNEVGKWTQLARISKEAPIICMDLLSKCSKPSGGFEDWIAVGDGKGCMTIVQVVGSDWNPKIEVTHTWLAEKERHLLGSYWCKSLENRFVFTADPGGRLKLWKLYHNLPSTSLVGREGYDALLIAEYASCFGMRIMCVDASFDEELLVCGDIRGNLLLFSLPRGLLCGAPIAAEVKASPVNYFKGAHGVSSVSSVSIGGVCSDQVEICSTGADGCICYLQHDRDLLNLEFKGMKQVKELSAIRSIFITADHFYYSSDGNYAVGFASENFIIWNLTSGTKVMQITCGGWRRPHSYYLGDFPEIMNCFSFVKDDIIYIHRHWVPKRDIQIYPRTLHLQFHGREIHSLCFISAHPLCGSDENQGLVSESSWIATGSEDGTVRLTRYEQGMENWSSSQHLGEHVGGSAVRSICFVSKTHIFMPDSIGTPNAVYGQNETSEDRENPLILISVGAKRVVTAWKQMITMRNNKLGTLCGDLDNTNEINSAPKSAASLSFQWLSTDMPFKHNVKRNNAKEILEKGENLSTTQSDAISVESLSLDLEDNLENDWRYLDVTAFLVKEAGSRISICFVVVACSDATVTVRALVLPSRLWFDVASLAPLASPVLSLQHVVLPKLLPSKGNFYLAISGSTDGSIGVWDLSECVENFVGRISSLEMEKYIEFQKRPRTGRGSQGGRRRRSIHSINAKKKTKDGEEKAATNGLVSVENNEKSVSEESNDAEALEGKRDDLLPETCELVAMHVLKNVHQSGVNCVYVSDIEEVSESNKLSFNVVSGGDDQAINCVECHLAIKPNCSSGSSSVSMNNEYYHRHSLIKNYDMEFLHVDKMASAHSSAVKGVWTDGKWIFSVGLDQRIRFWKKASNGNGNGNGLVECGHIIISVPEPEAIDVKSTRNDYYQIAVAGRGMQMVLFKPDC